MQQQLAAGQRKCRRTVQSFSRAHAYACTHARAADNTVNLTSVSTPADWASLVAPPRSTQPNCNDIGVNRKTAEVSVRLGIV